MKSSNYTKKKQPDIVRAQLLDAAAEITVEKGLAAITLDEVARKAGVSKGGLLHHFPSRQILIEALFRELLRRFGERIDEYIDRDPEPNGRFSRAYLTAVAAPNEDAFESRLFGSTMLAMSMDAALADAWRVWLSERLEASGEEQESAVGRIVRYAADGMWVEDSINGSQPDAQKRTAAVDRLIELSKEI